MCQGTWFASHPGVSNWLVPGSTLALFRPIMEWPLLDSIDVMRSIQYRMRFLFIYGDGLLPFWTFPGLGYPEIGLHVNGVVPGWADRGTLWIRYSPIRHSCLPKTEKPTVAGLS